MKTLLIIQCIYYYFTALWGLVDIKSFIKVTGPKKDIWLVKTVSMLLIAICNSIITALFFNSINTSIIILSISSCSMLAIIDIYYTLKGVISSVYLLDAFVQALLLIVRCFILA